jgi:hypothetical protein
MDADVAVDDELEPREPTPSFGQALELERELGIADVHHDLGRRRRHAVERHVDDLEGHEPLVDVSRCRPARTTRSLHRRRARRW